MRPGAGVEDRIEARIRRAWDGQPGGALRIASAAYGVIAGTRNLMYDSGLLACRSSPVPVVSIGGLTAGGSGKTPIAADLACRLGAAGVPTAILAHGFEDEMEVHRRLAPEARVYGSRSRVRLARQAAADGAQIIVLDSGFQHRRLHRDLDVVTLDVASASSRPAHLPAGPFREGLAALSRADIVVVVRRTPAGDASGSGMAEPIPPRLRAFQEAPDAPPFVRARIQPGPLVAANMSGGDLDRPHPAVAVAGVMWPEAFFAQVRDTVASEPETVSLRDHARIDASLGDRLRDMAGASGIVCTLKDSTKLVGVLGESVPIWYLSEKVIWEGQGSSPIVVRAALALLDPHTFNLSEGPAA